MDKTNKLNLRKGGSFNLQERHSIIQEFLLGNATKTELWKKYTGQANEHGHIQRWMKILGYISDKKSMPKKATKLSLPKTSKIPLALKNPEISNIVLQGQIKTLERQLEDAKLQAEGYALMIQIAEKEFKIPIRKKFNTK